MPILLCKQTIFTFEHFKINRQCVVEINVLVYGKFDALQAAQTHLVKGASPVLRGRIDPDGS